jgi:acyl-CoA reductase-like NAD-dependent aldehyde dehydrogenase
MTTTAASEDVLIAHNPANGMELGRVAATRPEDVPGIVAAARRAQAGWKGSPWGERRAFVKRLRLILARDAHAWAGALRDEIGKPFGEALGEVATTLDQLRWLEKNAERALKSERIGRGIQRLMLIPKARLEWRPAGVVGIIGTWNYPLFLNAPTIAAAVVAGNGVVWKPSELAACVGDRLQDAVEEAGLPEGLVSAVFGGGEVGAALTGAEIDAAHFTGGIDTGRKILGALGTRGIPATAELSGYDPAIVLPDAPFAKTVPPIAWAAFANAGQTCIAVKRVIVVGDADAGRRWAEAIAAEAAALRVGDPAGGAVDVGPMVNPGARSRFDRYVQAAVAAGATVLCGGRPREGAGAFYPPTVLLADPDNAGAESALAGCFGPVVIVRAVPTDEAAVAAANAGAFGLAASVWGRDRRRAEAIAARVESGMVAINDAVAPSAHAAAPFGGVKGSGYGRVHGVLGLRAFANPVTVHRRAAGGMRPQVFPYRDDLMRRGLDAYLRLVHGRRGRG